MAISVKHAFTSSKADGTDATQVQPSNWNDEHEITLATRKLLGRDTAGAGAVEEIDFSALAKTILAATDTATIVAALGIGVFSTGDVKMTLKTVADAGWVLMNDGTIGSASSGATARANADVADLYTVIWENITNTHAPVTGGRGLSAAADFAANKPIALTKVLGRALAAAGTGNGLSARVLGEALGAEAVALSREELPAVAPDITVEAADDHTHDAGGSNELGGGSNRFAWQTGNTGGSTRTTLPGGAHTHTATIENLGDGDAHNNMQPTTFLNVMVKL